MIITKEISKFLKVALSIIKKNAIVEGLFVCGTYMYAASADRQVAIEVVNEEIAEPIVIPTKAVEYLLTFPIYTKTELIVKGTTLTVKNGKSRVKFTLIGAETYPKKLEKEENGFVFSAGADIINTLKTVAVAGDYKSSKSIARSIHLLSFDNNLLAAATDGYKLASAVIPSAHYIGTDEITVPIEHLALMSVFSNSSEDTIDFYFGHNKRAVMLVQGEISLSMAMIESGSIEGVLRTVQLSKDGYSYRVNSDTIKDTMDKIALLATNDKNKCVKFTINGDSLSVTNVDSLNEYEQNISITDNTGEKEAVIGLNYSHLREFMSNISDEEVQVIYTTALKPVLMTVESRKIDFLLMPYRIK